MTVQEYETMQGLLSNLMQTEKLCDKGFNAKEREVYKKAVLACKSALSGFSPVKGASK